MSVSVGEILLMPTGILFKMNTCMVTIQHYPPFCASPIHFNKVCTGAALMFA